MEAPCLTDENGKRLYVILGIEEYERLQEIEDEVEDIWRYDDAMARRERGEEDTSPWEQVRDEIGSEYEEPTG